MESLFGSKEQTVPSVTGFGALPRDLQARFSQLGAATQPLLEDPSRFFAPQGLGAEELAAGDIIRSQLDPTAFRQSIEQYMSPFRDIITQDINKQFEAPQGALAARISQAGAFGGSRARGAQGDLERQRLDAIASALSGQYGQALGQRQQGIQNLLGFGGLQRGIDLAQRQALPQALGSVSNILSPLLQAKTGEGTIGAEEGGVSKAGKIAGLVSSGMQLASMFSDRRLKKNITKVGEEKGLNVYEYEYLWSPKKWVGYMADEVEKIYPEAISESMGYKIINYGMI